ncbi:MAG: hypothetical protein JNK65_05680 [Deltaproteobacteria bacterium]|nr:hypothetical protein [Deltaproteobacteria bacterium]
MKNPCEKYQDEMLDCFEGPLSTELLSHLKNCINCGKLLQSFKQVHQIYKTLPDLNPPAYLDQKILTYARSAELRAASKTPFWESLRGWFLHPAVVAASVFVITLGGVQVYKKLSFNTSSSEVAGGQKDSSAQSYASSELSPNPRLRMVDWNSAPRLIPDLDRPVMRSVDLASIEQTSVDSVAGFKHLLAMRHIMDGDYERAHQLLASIADRNLDYSQWQQVVMLHMNLMKKLGREEDVQRDLARLKEYAVAVPAEIPSF